MIQKNFIRCLLMVNLLVCMLSVSVAASKKSPAPDYKKIAAAAKWNRLYVIEINPLHSLFLCETKYDISVTFDEKKEYPYSFVLKLNGRKICTWEGHDRCAFRILNDRLYYVKYSIASFGGTIFAVDLKTGKELWESPLQAVGGIMHFRYGNTISFEVTGDILTIYGQESKGRYFEIKETKTGKTVGHKQFAKWTPQELQNAWLPSLKIHVEWGLYFANYLRRCPKNEIRCVWFSSQNRASGELMRIDLVKNISLMHRYVYNWAHQNSSSSTLNQTQIQSLRTIVKKMPKSTTSPMAANVLSVAYHLNGKLEIRHYDRDKLPAALQRVYDIGGGNLPTKK